MSEINQLNKLSEQKNKEYLRLIELKFKKLESFDNVKYDDLNEVNKNYYDIEQLTLQLESSNINLQAINTKLDTEKLENQEKKDLKFQLKIVEGDIKETEKELNLKKFNISNIFISTHLEDFINIYLCESEHSEVFIVKNLLNNTYQKCNKAKLMDLMKIICMRYRYVANLKNYFFNMKPSQFMDYCFRNRLIKETFDIGFKPTNDTNELKGNFYFEDKKLLNCYVPGVYESKKELYSLVKEHDKLTNQEIYSKFEFPLIDQLIKHLTGDKRVFMINTIELLTNEKYKKIAKKELHLIVNCLNIKIMSSNVKEQKQQIVTHCEETLNLLNNDPKYINTCNLSVNYFYSWLAFIYQRPLFKLPNGCGIKTSQGAGKDIFVNWILSSIWGEHNIKSIGQSDMNEKFNGYIRGSRFIVANELEYSRENNAMYENLKRLMTNTSITLREMHKTQYNIPNYSHFLFFGNHDNMLRIEKGDRRLTLYEQMLICPKLIPFKLSPDIIDVKGKLLNPGTLTKELDQFSRFLFNLKVSFEDVERPLQTDIKSEIQEYHKTDVEVFLEKFKEFRSFEEVLEYYEVVEDNNIKRNPQDPIDNNKLRVFRTSSNLINDHLVPNEILFKLFKAICKEEGFNSRRAQRSFSKALSINNIIEDPKTLWCNVLGKGTKGREIKSLMKFTFKKDVFNEECENKILNHLITNNNKIEQKELSKHINTFTNLQGEEIFNRALSNLIKSKKISADVKKGENNIFPIIKLTEEEN